MLPSLMPRSAISLLMRSIRQTSEILSVGFESRAARAAAVMFFDPFMEEWIWFLVFAVSWPIRRLFIYCRVFLRFPGKWPFEGPRAALTDHVCVIMTAS